MSEQQLRRMRCLGCAPPILDVGHGCGGDRTPVKLGWRCDCPEPECQRRQAGDWTGSGRPNGRKRRQPNATR